jgi:biofilm PGA synthesis N-glycosyltransferase PgaC
MIVTALATNDWVWFPFWLGVGSVFLIDRVVSAWAGGWKARLLAILLIPELTYDMFLDIIYIKGIIDITFARNATWGHVTHAPQPCGETAATGRLDVAEVTP